MEEEWRCCAGLHRKSWSIYPKNRVPLEFFLKIPSNPKSSLLKKCRDCRIAAKSDRKTKRDARKRRDIPDGYFFCRVCEQTKLLNQRGTNVSTNEINNNMCINCKQTRQRNYESARKRFHELKMEQVLKQQACCFDCKCIFLKSEVERSLNIRIFEQENGLIKGTNIIASEFIQANLSNIELRVLELDHLSEEEQRAKGVLKEGEKFVPKHCNVGSIANAERMRLEFAKTQLVCAKCHHLRTRKRRNQNGMISKYSNRNFYIKIKKMEIKYCQGCFSKIDTKILGFYEFDHLEPKLKVTEISKMHNIQHIKSEIAKCRLLCRFCHAIHTWNQNHPNSK